MKTPLFKPVFFLIFLGLFLPAHFVEACSCGCGIYDVGTSYNFPSGPGGMVWAEYDFQSQDRNWSGIHRSPAASNEDKLVQTSWLSTGFQYYWNSSWGAELVVPSAIRVYTFENPDVMAPAGSTLTKRWWGMGDIRLNGHYTGFSSDMSTGINLGFKLPTGYWREAGVDRDNQIGTGSTDILVGFFHRHRITLDAKWSWFVQGQLNAPVIIQSGYRPGLEIDAAAGVYYTGLHIGNVKVRPIAQVLFSNRASDSGPESSPQNTGYQRLLLSPGLELDIHPVRIYADAELPVLSNVVGNQLISPCQIKVTASFMF